MRHCGPASDDVSELTNLAKQTDAANRYLDDVAELGRLVAQDFPAGNRIHEIERRILEGEPRTHQEAASIVTVASTWMLADADLDMINDARAALKRVAAYLGGVPAASAAYYGVAAAA